MAADRLPDAWDAAYKRTFRRRLLAWYARHRRDLPWRQSSDPYCVWVSEIMLQQTQVATVEAYFRRFIDRLPTVEDLAAADEAVVLRLWEGLGYYRRARGLHAAAKVVVAEHAGRLPDDVPTLMQLPGIGRYTAGAIASIAYNRRAPILEANTIRLLTRLLAYRDDPSRSAGQRLLWEAAEALLPRNNVADFNQAMMELGSLVCRPSEPDCPNCPVAAACAARAAGIEEQLPYVRARQTYTDLREAAVVVRKKGRVLMRQCGEEERWAGLWDYPRFEVEAAGPLLIERELVEKVRNQSGVEVRLRGLLDTLRHGVTRYRITLDCYLADYETGRVRSTAASPVKWIAVNQLDALPLSTTGRKIAKLVR